MNLKILLLTLCLFISSHHMVGRGTIIAPDCLHLVASITPDTDFVVKRNGIVIISIVRSSRLGTLSFRGPGIGSYEITPVQK